MLRAIKSHLVLHHRNGDLVVQVYNSIDKYCEGVTSFKMTVPQPSAKLGKHGS